MSLEERTITIPARCNRKIELRAIPGHFATNHSHINYYLDMTPIKCRHIESQLVAKEMVKKYQNNTAVETIICMDGCEVIGAFLAEELSKSGIMSLNAHECINVVTPEINASGQIIFRDNTIGFVENKHIILLLASATTGKTIQQSIEGIRYYGGIVEGVSALFSATTNVAGMNVDAIYNSSDVKGYQTFKPSECPHCQAGERLDAIVNSFGYSKI